MQPPHRDQSRPLAIIRVSDIRTGHRAHRVGQTGRRRTAELSEGQEGGHRLSQRAPVRDPGRSVFGKPRPLRAVAGASIAPPLKLREMIGIVPHNGERLALIYFDRRLRPCARDA
jgi:hypothetical protein